MAFRVWYQKTSPLAFSALGVEERRYFGRMLYKLQIWTLLRAWNFGSSLFCVETGLNPG